MRGMGLYGELARQREIETKRIARDAWSQKNGHVRRPPGWDQPVTIRMAAPGDRPRLERLAESGKAAVPEGPSLIADVGERPVAALALGDGSLLVDPHPAAAQIVALLQLRARQLSEQTRALTGLRAVAHRLAAWR